jgi:hypothetical protein
MGEPAARLAQAPESSRAIQLQPNPKDPVQQAFHRMIEKHFLMEKIKAPVVEKITDAYLNSSEGWEAGKPIVLGTLYGTRTLPGIPQKKNRQKVYNAISSGLDINQLPNGNNPGTWQWTPGPPPEAITGRDAVKQTVMWAIGDVVGGENIPEIAMGKLKDGAIKLTTLILEEEGLAIIASMVTGVGAIIGFWAFTCSALELLTAIAKAPKKKEPTESDLIRESVKAWLARRQEAAEAAAEMAETLNKPFKHEIYRPPAVTTGVADRVAR